MAYTPASAVRNAGLATSQAQFYDRVGIENLKSNLVFYQHCTERRVPLHAGVTTNIFGYDLFAANTTPATEGAVGTGKAPTTHTVAASLGQFADFVSFSDLLLKTAIDPIVKNISAELGYEAALSVNAMTQNEFDAATALDASSTQDLGAAAYLTSQLIRQKVQALYARDVRPIYDGGMLGGIVHPLAWGDLENDTANNGFIDILKRTETGLKRIEEGANAWEAVDAGGIRWLKSSTATSATQINSAPTYSTYICGKDCLLAIGLGDVKVPRDQRNFQLIISEFKPSVADPSGLIGAAAAYNYMFVAAAPPSATMRFRRIRSNASFS